MDFLRESFHFRIKAVDAGARFLKRLKGIEEPEQKRRVIGGTFIDANLTNRTVTNLCIAK